VAGNVQPRGDRVSAPTTCVTGASAGLGLEFVRQCLDRGDQVVAGTRQASPELTELGRRHGTRLIVLPLDVGDESSISASRRALEGRVASVALLINNAGFYSHQSRNWNPAATSLASVSSDELLDVFRINAAGPILMVRHYLDLLEAGQARILNLSSLVGSVSHKTGPGDYAYAASKAALNIMTRALAAELTDQGVIPIAITPGWVRTDMGGAGASLTPAESVRGMLAVATSLTRRDAGRFVDYQGETQPW
jgi:NAD(P)-dependent dehydrogenase (short-subunit alcohol dehydrogenase family)